MPTISIGIDECRRLWPKGRVRRIGHARDGIIGLAAGGKPQHEAGIICLACDSYFNQAEARDTSYLVIISAMRE